MMLKQLTREQLTDIVSEIFSREFTIGIEKEVPISRAEKTRKFDLAANNERYYFEITDYSVENRVKIINKAHDDLHFLSHTTINGRFKYVSVFHEYLSDDDRDYLKKNLIPRVHTCELFFYDLNDIQKLGEKYGVIRKYEFDNSVNSNYSKIINNKIDNFRGKFYAVGSYWEGDVKMDDFVADNEWINGDENVDTDIVNRVEKGDVLILKSSFPKKGVGIFRVKALGKVLSNDNNGKRLKVKWEILPEVIDIEGKLNKYRTRISEINKTEAVEVFNKVELLESQYTYLFDSNSEYSNSKDFSSTLIANDYDSEDALGFNAEAKSFAALLSYKNMRPPLAIALYGKWGSGKSFFMYLIEKNIRKLSNIEANNSNHNDSIFVNGVAHVKFNAWSYIDGNLWSGLAYSLFEKLDLYIRNSSLGIDERQTVHDKLKKRLNILRIGNENVVKEKNDLLHQLEQIKIRKENKIIEYTSKKYSKDFLKFLTGIGIDENQAKLLLPNELKHVIRKSYGFINYLKLNSLSILFWTSGGLFLLYLIHEIIPSDWYFSFFESLYSWGFKVYMFVPVLWIAAKYILKMFHLANLVSTLKAEKNDELKNVFQTIVSEIDDLEHKIEAKETEIDLLEVSIENIDDYLVPNFIRNTVKNGKYSNQLGIVSMLRKDFATLSDLFTGDYSNEDVDAEFQKDSEIINQAFEVNKLERIVLYIDDLDRCTDEKVMEVLEAVHLLMAYPLFVVIVGIDDRIVNNAFIHRDRLKQRTARDNESFRLVSSNEYLEKIFQINYRIPAPTDNGVKVLISKILEAENSFKKIVNEDSSLSEEVKLEDSSINQLNPKSESTESNVEGELNEGFVEDEIVPKMIVITEQEKEWFELFTPIIDQKPRTIKTMINIFRLIKVHNNIDSNNNDEQSFRTIFVLALNFGKNKDWIKYFIHSGATPIAEIGKKLKDNSLRPYFVSWSSDISLYELFNTPSYELEYNQKLINRFLYEPVLFSDATLDSNNFNYN